MYIRVSEAKYRVYMQARRELIGEGVRPTRAQRRRVFDMHYELFYTGEDTTSMDLTIVEHPLGETHQSSVNFLN